MTTTSPPPTITIEKPQRLLSLDALRGFDMFWIIGGEMLIHDGAKLTHAAPMRVLRQQFNHKPWEGFAFYDLIFPLFVFLVGVSIVFSLTKHLAADGKAKTTRKIIVRTVVLYLIGILYYGGLSRHWHDIRLLGVLQRIALCYGATALLFVFLSPRVIAAVALFILLAYWALLSFVPVPGVGHASFEEGKNWPNYIDSRFLPLRKWDGDHDPEGILSTFPAIVTCILGTFAGRLLRDSRFAPPRKVLILFAAGAAAVGLGFLWGLQFPVIKKLWTSSYVLVAAGYSALLLGLFYLIIDVWKFQLWSRPFVWIGANAITLYLIVELIDFPALAARLVGGDFGKAVFAQFDPLVVSTLAMVLLILLARFLYRRQIFLRV